MVSKISNNQRFGGSTALGGYSHGIPGTDSPTVMTRDPLTDPLLTGKTNEMLRKFKKPERALNI